jgi:anti-sigma factor RsiW
MTHCENVRELLGAWLDGELNPGDASSIQLHVDQCAACNRERQQLDRLQSVIAGVVGAGAAEIAFEPFWQGVQQRISERSTWRARLPGWFESAFSPLRLAWAVPAVIALLLGLLSLESLVPSWRQEAQRNNFASVESIDAYGRNVALFRDNDTNTTVIWLYQNQEGEDDSSGEPTETGHSF